MSRGEQPPDSGATVQAEPAGVHRFATVAAASPLGQRGRLAFGLLCLVQFMVTLDESIVVVALPAIGRDLGFAPTDLQWVVSGYALTFGGFLVLAGRAGDLFGRRRLFLTGLAVFSAASLAAGLAPSSTLLVLARLVQGVGAAIVAPAVLSLITTMFDEGAQRARGLAVWGAAAAGGAAAGLLAGGVLMAATGWRWLFFVNVPIGMLGLAVAPVLLAESRRRAVTARLDLAGAVTLTSALGLLIFALTRAETVGLVSAPTLTTVVAAAAMLLAFWLVERRSAAPLVPLDAFRSPTLTGASLVVVLLFACQAALAFFGTLYMQQTLGYSPLVVGFAFLPVPLLVLAIATLGGPRAVGRFGAARLMATGMIALVVAMLVFSRIRPGGSYLVDLLTGILVFGVALGLTYFTSVIVATTGLRADRQGLASGMVNTAQQIGIALGPGLLVPIAAARTRSEAGVAATSIPAAIVSGYETAFLVAAVLAAAGAVIALIVVRASKGSGDSG